MLQKIFMHQRIPQKFTTDFNIDNNWKYFLSIK